MAEKVTAIEAGISVLCGALTVLWGWIGWMVVALIVMMLIDYVTGTAAAIRKGEWSSERAREGLWHKGGSMLAVIAAGILDMVIGMTVDNLGIGFEYTVGFLPICVVWYFLTEMGSVLENVGGMGAPMPAWLKKAVANLKDKVDAEGGNADGKSDNN